jgi:hypothetical protein
VTGDWLNGRFQEIRLLHAGCAGQDNQCMQNPKGSSMRALDALERAMFWQGFDSEAEAYLKKHPQELAERDTFGQVSSDGMGPGSP